MKQRFLPLLLCTSLFALFALSCSKESIKEKAKSATKAAAEVGMSAVEGLAEAVDENGEKIGKLTADATGKLALGAGKSINEQLDAHSADVAKVAGRTMVQVVDGTIEGMGAELEKMYTIVPHSSNKQEGIAISYMGKYKNGATVDTYFEIESDKSFDTKFECVDQTGKVFLTKNMIVSKGAEEGKKNTIASFAMTPDELKSFDQLKEIKVTLSVL